ncbi:MBL fold metallo-hydrolase [Novosphingobium sp.]|uniref:MBL fold metallo-hydrolase n=1 Tax=Novosphingobium sp. TaxID=1874826 RepID=UPI0025F07222|nr:MBL fold metallo-hydrolase [Novosphingobium sp.]MCC6924477.1 MBL fold metallo-hydrolase [Novosphingobium sp.]
MSQPPLSWQVGDVTVTRIVEMMLPLKGGAEGTFLPQATREALRKHPWLYPHFVSEADELLLSIHALLVDAPGLRLVVDTCIGNDKPRNLLGGVALSTPFLRHMEKAGWSRESVDAVVCTHMHVDHVGWNTMRQGDHWVPTFPKARYLFAQAEYDHWNAFEEDNQRQIMADSVQPILDAGLAAFVELDHRISDEVRLVPTVGHTPGHVSVGIESKGQRAVITGDMSHHPCQMPHPDWSPAFDSDPRQAAETRARMFGEWADGDVLVIGTHYAGPTAGKVRREGDAFRFEV